MNAWISRTFLILFLALVVAARFISAIPGQRWPWFVASAVFAVAALITGTRRNRTSAVFALVIAAVLIADDLSAGKKARDLHRDTVMPHQQQKATTNGAVSSILPLEVKHAGV